MIERGACLWGLGGVNFILLDSFTALLFVG